MAPPTNAPPPAPTNAPVWALVSQPTVLIPIAPANTATAADLLQLHFMVILQNQSVLNAHHHNLKPRSLLYRSKAEFKPCPRGWQARAIPAYIYLKYLLIIDLTASTLSFWVPAHQLGQGRQHVLIFEKNCINCLCDGHH